VAACSEGKSVMHLAAEGSSNEAWSIDGSAAVRTASAGSLPTGVPKDSMWGSQRFTLSVLLVVWVSTGTDSTRGTTEAGG
jgi:hypothetical protein